MSSRIWRIIYSKDEVAKKGKIAGEREYTENLWKEKMFTDMHIYVCSVGKYEKPSSQNKGAGVLGANS